jgi:hypothetical protein
MTLVSSAQPAQYTALSSMNPGASGVGGFFRAARQRRVDIAICGTQWQGTVLDGGWEHGFAAALAERLPLYATGLVTLRDYNGANASSVLRGYKWASKNSSTNNASVSTGVPAEFEAYLNDYTTGSCLFPSSSFYLANLGSIGSSCPGLGWMIAADNPIDPTGHLKLWYPYGKFAPGDGTNGKFYWTCINQTSGADLLVDSAVSTAGTTREIAFGTLDIPAGTYDGSGVGMTIRPRPNNDGFKNVVGPVWLSYMRVTNEDRQSGVAVSVMQASLNRTIGAMKTAVTTVDDDTAIEFWLERLVETQERPGDEVACFLVEMGEPDDGTDTTALLSDLADFRAALEARWAACGFPPDNLYWIYMVQSPLSTPPNETLEAHRAALSEVAITLPRTVAIDLSSLTSYEEITDENWDSLLGYMLTDDGATAIARRVVDVLFEESFLGRSRRFRRRACGVHDLQY